ncbi:MAG: hypothetical protein Q9170_006314 [Blastenia crenularia]
MSLQTRVLENGRWTARTLDIHQILARNREEKMEIQNLSTGPKPPVFGLLTKTIMRSPIIQAIIPARIRHRTKNDVVFVYQDAVVIKEVLGGERIEQDPFSDIFLDNQTVKKDFDSPIQAARIIGLPREPKLSRFPGRFWDGEYMPHPPLETKPEPFHENEIPPQILVLSLASCKLVFLFAYYDIHDAVHFVSDTWPLPGQIPLMEELGVHLAVDPKSRAMAVGAYEKQITIHALKSMDQIQGEVQKPEGLDPARFRPIREEKHIAVDGFILKMEFLHPSKGDEHHVILLLVVSKEQMIRLVRIEWDCRTSLHEIEQKPGQVLPHPDRMPLLLIPLTYGTAFALVCEHHIVVYKDILTGHANGRDCQLEHYEPHEEPGGSKRPPIWTQWARPMRAVERRRPNIDNIYLCREDGVVRYIDFKADSDTMIGSNYDAGFLDANVGSAFATIDLGDESNDLLVAGGEMGDGGMWYFKPRQPLDLVGTFRNWTPLKALVNAPVDQPADDSVENGAAALAETGRLFACCGRGPKRGSVLEVRVGTEAVILGPTVDFEELMEKGIDNMWVLPDRSNSGIYLMVAHPTDTELILLPAANDQDPKVSNDEELDLGVRTIAAGSTAEGFIIQVTQHSINAIAQVDGILPFTSKLSNATITAACFLTIPLKTTVLLTVVQKDDGFYLHHGHFGVQGGQIAFAELGEPILLRSEASTISIQWVDDRIIAFVGTLAGTVQSYTADPGSTLVPYFEYSFGDDLAICDSLAMVTTEESAEVEVTYLLVCGLRNGSIQTLFFNGNGCDEALSLCEALELGTTSIKILADATRSSRAILVCERNIFVLEYAQRPSPTNPAMISRIWLTHPGKLDPRQGPVDCFTQASSRVPHGCSKFGAGSLFYLTGSSLLLADISSSPSVEMVPRRLPLGGTPSRVIYSAFLNKLIVLYTTATINSRSPSGSRRDRPHSRTLKPALAFLDPDAGSPRPGPDTKDSLNVLKATDIKDGERVLGTMEWFPNDGSRKKYHVLVINTIVGQAAGDQATGRLLLFSLSTGEDGDISLDLRKKIDCNAPVWCVACDGDSSLIYACGDELVLHHLYMGTRRRFDAEATIKLHSPATHISVDGNTVHVSTKGSGHHVLHIEDSKLIPVCADASGRYNIHHVCIPEKSLVMTSDHDRKVAGLWQPPQPQLSRTAPLVFEATLPSPITRFCKIARPVWQRKFPKMGSQAIVGSSDDGTLYQLVVLSEPALRLLAFIQNMALRDARICPYPHPLVFEKHIEPSMSKKYNMHVNGDILQRLLERGGASLLEDMLSKGPTEPSPDYGPSDYATAKDRRKRFGELAKDLFDGPAPEIVEHTLGWIRSLLLAAF